MATSDAPLHLRWRSIALVAAGAVIGVASREGLTLVIPDLAGMPIATEIINVLGAFALGYLYEAFSQTPPGSPTATTMKLLLGTGFCGGFTTYSALATDTVLLGAQGRADLALAYALGTVLLGALATWAGIAVGASQAARSPKAQPAERPSE